MTNPEVTKNVSQRCLLHPNCCSYLTHSQITEQEVFLGGFVANVVVAIDHLKNAEAEEQLKGVQLLERSGQELTAYSRSHFPESCMCFSNESNSVTASNIPQTVD